MAYMFLFTLLSVLDYITGLAAAYVTGKIDSKVNRAGLIRKATLLFVLWCLFIFVNTIAPTYIDPEFAFPFASMSSLVTSGFIIYEVVSLIENFGLLGVKIPTSIIEGFSRLKDDSDNKKL